MPEARIETRSGWLGDRAAEFIEAVHAAMTEVLRLPPHDRVVRLFEHAPDHFAIPPGRSDHFTLVEIMMFDGRTTDTKRKLYKAIVANLAAFEVPAEEVMIVLKESPLENWGIRGGQAACDVELAVDVSL
jgi:phenylpyruvate tautomerase PptA (4-oxalocrotonate tautomerase family)